MHAIMTALSTAALMLCQVEGALARELTSDESSSLEQSVRAFEDAVETWDINVVVENMPVRMTSIAAARMGMTDEKYRQVWLEDGRLHPPPMKIESFVLDLTTATYTETSDGTPYVMIPTETLAFSDAAGRTLALETTLALLDDGSWHLMRLDEEMVLGDFRTAYPEFVDVVIPAGSMMAVSQ
jgi:hypothetical protein